MGHDTPTIGHGEPGPGGRFAFTPGGTGEEVRALLDASVERLPACGP
jgi:hypothetical protein